MAFLTMIASSALTRIIRDENCREPGQMLKRLNVILKTALRQDTAYAVSDDGLDAALCVVHSEEKRISFAGARIPLFLLENGEMTIIKGDRQSIGYKQSKRSDIGFDFTCHEFPVRKGMAFYMASDGFADQMGPDQDRQSLAGGILSPCSKITADFRSKLSGRGFLKPLRRTRGIMSGRMMSRCWGLGFSLFVSVTIQTTRQTPNQKLAFSGPLIRHGTG